VYGSTICVCVSVSFRGGCWPVLPGSVPECTPASPTPVSLLASLPTLLTTRVRVRTFASTSPQLPYPHEPHPGAALDSINAIFDNLKDRAASAMDYILGKAIIAWRGVEFYADDVVERVRDFLDRADDGDRSGLERAAMASVIVLVSGVVVC
jgi:hypothetical protein